MCFPARGAAKPPPAPGFRRLHPASARLRSPPSPSHAPQAQRSPQGGGAGTRQRRPPLTCRGPCAAPAAPEGERGPGPGPPPAPGNGGAVAVATRRGMAAGGRPLGLWQQLCAGGRRGRPLQPGLPAVVWCPAGRPHRHGSAPQPRGRSVAAGAGSLRSAPSSAEGQGSRAGPGQAASGLRKPFC